MQPSLFLIVFGFFLKTACGGVSYDDSGEICLAAAHSSVLHPPGYPLFAAIAKLWAIIPAGSISFRMNVLSALLSAGSVSLLFWIWRRIMPAFSWAGWLGALLAGCATGLWGQSGTAKGGIYSLNVVLTLAAIGLFLSGGERGRPKAQATLWAGMSLGHHWMSVLGLLPLAVMDAVRRRAGLRSTLIGLIVFSLGVSVYLCLPLRAAERPFLNWGRTDNLSRLGAVVLRAQYGKGGVQTAPVMARLRQLSESLDRTAPWPAVCAAAVAGAVYLFFAHRAFLAGLGIFLATLYGSLLYYGAIRIGAPWYLEIFSIPGTMLIILLAGLGVAWFCDLVARGRAKFLPVVISGLLALSAVFERWHECDRSSEYLTHDLAVNLADSGSGRRLLLANSDVIVFGNWEIWRIQERNRELYVVPAPLLPQPWVAISFSRAIHGIRAPYPAPRTGTEAVPALMRAWFEANKENFSVYTFKTDASRNAFGAEDMRTYGLAAQVGKGRPVRSASAGRMRLRGLFDCELDREPRKRATFQPIYFSGFLSWANESSDETPDSALVLLRLAWRLADSAADQALVQLARGNIQVGKGRVPHAIELYREACRLDPALATAWRNLAVAQMSLGHTREAMATFRKLKQAAPESQELNELAGMLDELERGRALGR